MSTNLLAFSDLLKDVKNYFANFSSAENSCRTIMLWIAIALIIAYIVLRIVFANTAKKTADEGTTPDNRIETLNKLTRYICLAYTVAAIVAFTAIYFVDISNGDEYFVPITFYPLAVCIVVAIVSAIVVVVKPGKVTKIVGLSVTGAAILAAIICILVYNVTGDASEWNYIFDDEYNSPALYISAVAVIAVIIAIGFLSDRGKSTFDTRSISYAAVCIALSYALSFIKFFKMPMGGSITFASMLPLMLYSYMFGCKKGLLAGLIYGVLDAITDPWILHPAQFALDYLVAYSAVGLAGCLRNVKALNGKVRTQFTLGAVIAVVMRFISSYFSGVFAFGTYASYYAEEYNIAALANPYFYSFVYQAMYLIPELIIVLVVGVILLSSKNFTRQIINTGNFEKQTQNSPSVSE